MIKVLCRCIKLNKVPREFTGKREMGDRVVGTPSL